jgi:hypothetical protein
MTPHQMRERFRRELVDAPGLDENGYICTKHEALMAFDRLLRVILAEPHAGNYSDQDDPRTNPHPI